MPFFSYEIGGDSVTSSSPYWILAVVPMSIRFTIDMDSLTSFEQDVSNLIAKEFPADSDRFMLLDSHCVSWSTSSSKTQHVHTASFTLVPPEVIHETGEMGVETYRYKKVSSSPFPRPSTFNTTQSSEPVPVNPVDNLVQGYFEESKEYVRSYNIAPQDWVMFWAMNDLETYQSVRKRIKNGQAANFPLSGLKFVGKVEAFTSNVMINENGTKITRFSMECSSFRELNNGVYYNPLAFPKDQNLKTVNDLVAGINDFLIGNNDLLYISTQEAMFKLTSLFFDVDFQKEIIKKAVGTPEILQALQRFAATSQQYLIPKQIAQWLGADTSIDNSTYGSILFRYAGVEQYPVYAEGTSSPRSSFSAYHSSLLTKAPYRNAWEWDVPLSSRMIKQTLHFDNRPIWGVLTTYLNEPVDEMYTTLKVTKPIQQFSESGSDLVDAPVIMPSVVCRQLPFTSNRFASIEPPDITDSLGTTKLRVGTTRFTDLPRWVVNDSYVTSYRVGLSDSMDVNYVHLQPFIAEPGLNADLIRANALVFSPPIIDFADISKNGLRMYQREMSSYVLVGKDQSSIDTMKWWNALMADIMMRMKYMANGNVVCKGIQEPICIGDNAYVFGTLFHIESISHQGGIDVSGRKTFDTTLGLSMGVKLGRDSNSDKSKKIFLSADRGGSLPDPANLPEGFSVERERRKDLFPDEDFIPAGLKNTISESK